MALSSPNMTHEFEPHLSQMTLDYSKLKKVVSPIAATILDIMSLLEQTNTAFGMSHVFFSIPVRNENQIQYTFMALLQNCEFFLL